MDEMIQTFCAPSIRQEEELSDEDNMMRKLASTPLYEGATMSKLRACLSLLDLQATYGWSDASVSSLMKLLQKMLPNPNTMSNSRRDAKQMLAMVGMDYNSIHACANDCILYRGEYVNLTSCPRCQKARYRQDLQGQNVPIKVLRHFPLIKRICHMFKCKSISQMMTWHAENYSTDEVMRVPSDTPAWKHIDTTWPEFAMEPRNLRLGLAMDGVNPYGLRSTTWSTWPVVLVNYNIPPWLSIKKGFLILALLIPGKYKVKNMDVYMEPLIEELEILWRGIHVHDISRLHSEDVLVRGILMWTMHDFPGYGECSGRTCISYLFM